MSESAAPPSRKNCLVLVLLLAIPTFGCCACTSVTTWYVYGTFHIFVVPQKGMYPGIDAGSRIIALKNPYASPGQVKRGDVVMFAHAEMGTEILYIWRVIALPGDKIQTSGDSVTINGKQLTRERMRSEGELTIFEEANGDARYEVAYQAKPDWIPPAIDVVVPADQFFVLGDNRDAAGKDSRTIGPIRFKSIVGKKW